MVIAAGTSPAVASAERIDATGRVLVIAAPTLTWERVRDHPTPSISALLNRSALASMSSRTGIAVTTPANAYLTLGAGNRVGTDPDPADGLSGLMLQPGDPLDPGLSIRSVVKDPPDRGVAASPVVGALVEAAASGHYNSRIGALAASLESAGRSIAAIGTAATGPDDLTGRDVGWAGAGPDGVLRAGAVGPELLGSSSSPARARLDNDAVAAAATSALSIHDVVVVELSDLRSSDGADQAARDEALDRSDELIGRLIASLGPGDTVMLTGIVPPAGDEQLTVFALAGPGVAPGLASSSSTRRSGFVALTDLAPTILGGMGIAVPSTMDNTRITTESSELSSAERLQDLVDANDRAVLRDGTWANVATIYVVVLLIALVLTLARHRGVSRLGSAINLLSLWVLWVPPVTYMVAVVPVGSITQWSLVGSIFAASLIVAVAALALVPARRAAVATVAVGWAMFTIDMVTGAHLQLSTTFGYSPILAGRFAGMGNVAFAIYAMSALILISVVLDSCRRGSDDRPDRRSSAMILLLLSVTIVVNGAPAWGSDVGGVLALVPTSALVVVMAFRLRVRPLTVLIGVIAPLAVIGAVAWFDMTRPVDQRTHLGRFAAKLTDPGVGDVVARKLAASASQFQVVVAWAVPVAMVLFAYWTWRPTKMVRMISDRHRGYVVLAVSGLTIGLISMLVNDSGVSLPATMMEVVLAYLCVLYVVASQVVAPDPDVRPASGLPASDLPASDLVVPASEASQ